MEDLKISKLLINFTVSKFVTTKQNKLNNWLDGQYYIDNNIRSKTPMLRSDLRD